MNYQSSYKLEQFAADAHAEIERLHAQVDLFWDKELSFYKEFGFKDGLSVVECGCGPGIVGLRLLEAFPNCRITAFEIDPILVRTAQDNAIRWGLDGYEVSERSILDTKLPDNTFDFAITRLVLEHLQKPEEAVGEVFRILKPGGKAVFVDNDFEYHLRTYPDIPELGELYQSYCHAREDEHGNPKIGRELPRILKNGGFSNIDLQVVCAHNGILGDDMFLKSEGSGIPAQLIKDGYLSDNTYTQIARKWSRLLKTDGHCIFRQLFIGVGEKGSQDIHEQLQTSAAQSSSAPKRQSAITSEGKKSRRQPQKAEAYEGDVEQAVARIWAEVLERSDIGRHENFFEAGGSSIHAPEIADRIEQDFNINMSVVDLFNYPTIAALASHLSPQSQSDKIGQEPDRKQARLKKIQARREQIKRMRSK